MRIPDTRSEYVELEYSSAGGASQPEKNKYWQAYLNDVDAVWIDGYDICMNAVDDMFHKLGIMPDDTNDVALYADYLTEDIGIDPKRIDGKVIFNNEKMLSEYTDREKASMTLETKIIRGMREIMYLWLESMRDQIIVGCIDEMEQEEYEKIKADVENGSYQNAIIERLEAEDEEYEDYEDYEEVDEGEEETEEDES